MRAACVAAFFIPLMAVGPQAVLAVHNEALMYSVLSTQGAAGFSLRDSSDTRTALGAGNDIVVLYTYTYDANGNTLSKSDGTDTNT